MAFVYAVCMQALFAEWNNIKCCVAFHSMLIVYELCVFYCYYYCSLLFRVCFSSIFTTSHSHPATILLLLLLSCSIYFCLSSFVAIFNQPTSIQQLNVLNGNDFTNGFCKRAISNGRTSLLSWFHIIYFMYLICSSRIYLYIYFAEWNQTKTAIRMPTAIDDSAIFFNILETHINVCIHEQAHKFYFLILLRNLSAQFYFKANENGERDKKREKSNIW